MKKIIILSQGKNNGELANQLWNYISIYAYAQEKGYERIINDSFYEYGNFFANLGEDRTPIANALFFSAFTGRSDRKSSTRKKWYRRLYRYYSSIAAKMHGKNIVSSTNAGSKEKTDKKNTVFHLPPSTDIDPANGADGIAKHLPNEQDATLCFEGWLFRNPAGISKYRDAIRSHFAPNAEITKSTQEYVKNIRAKYKHVVGIHLRQSDYRVWQGGAYFIEQKRVREIMEEYLAFRKIEKVETCFVIASDGAIDEQIFTGINIAVTKKNMAEDLFILASTDAIIGSNSTFGAFASYYGNIPHIVMQKSAVDWPYYEGKDAFFENKYLTWVYFR